jgi:hypothetical protein
MTERRNGGKDGGSMTRLGNRRIVKGKYFAWGDELRCAREVCELTGSRDGSALRGQSTTILTFADCTLMQAIRVLRVFRADRAYLDLES